MNNKQAFILARFIETAHTRKELGDTVWRKRLMTEFMDTFPGVTNASAASYYNAAKKSATLSHPHLVEGLGRAPGKNNGGRAVINPFNVVAESDGTVVAQGLSRGMAMEKIAELGRTQPGVKYNLVAGARTEPQASTSQAVALNPSLISGPLVDADDALDEVAGPVALTVPDGGIDITDLEVDPVIMTPIEELAE